jgi:hypothetical protein
MQCQTSAKVSYCLVGLKTYCACLFRNVQLYLVSLEVEVSDSITLPNIEAIESPRVTTYCQIGISIATISAIDQ